MTWIFTKLVVYQTSLIFNVTTHFIFYFTLLTSDLWAFGTLMATEAITKLAVLIERISCLKCLEWPQDHEVSYTKIYWPNNYKILILVDYKKCRLTRRDLWIAWQDQWWSNCGYAVPVCVGQTENQVGLDVCPSFVQFYE